MRNTFFTADTHFNHANIIYFCQRPFSNVIEMNETIIGRWNARVGKGDLIYHLGDIAWGDWRPVLERLNGDMILIRGGHDKKSEKKFAGRFLHTADLMDISIEGYSIVLCHYCLRVWNKAILIHGISSGTATVGCRRSENRSMSASTAMILPPGPGKK